MKFSFVKIWITGLLNIGLDSSKSDNVVLQYI